ncbi:MAG: cell surface protein [Rikenellaceae bacterium]|nr:cell surface protein [Rikenellaceae bacterium]
MKQKLTTAVLLALLTLVMASCGKSEEQGNPGPPQIALDSPTGTYVVKVGRTLVIAPTYQNDAGAMYVWKIDGRIVGREKTYTVSTAETGTLYITLEVTTDYGTEDIEMRVDIVDRQLPAIALSIPDGGYRIVVGSPLELEPLVENIDGATFLWTVNGSDAGTEQSYTFPAVQAGDYTIVCTVTNEDGSDRLEIPVKVCTPDEMPFSWVFERTAYSLSAGRAIRLMPFDVTNAFDAEYTWTVDGVVKQKGREPAFIFRAADYAADKAAGHTDYDVRVTMSNAYGQRTQALTVTVSGEEGTYYRRADAGSSDSWNRVYEFLAAPGQFVNEDYTATTMAEACAYAENMLRVEHYVSLGAFGGYIVVGFDHSIDNDGGYNIQIKGNSFAGSSEPGIVYVMQDENGNGLPDDTWYELKGSEHGKPETIQDYAVTYYRPRAVGMPVLWTDNRGGSGSVDYLSAYHGQDYYYPNWVTADSYTLRGTRLDARTVEVTPGYWSNDAFEWGYADNFSSVDRLTDDDNGNAGANGNHFRISDAITFDGQPADLRYIDFVKVQTGVQAKAGWLGENSTEVFNFKDFNLIKNKK